MVFQYSRGSNQWEGRIFEKSNMHDYYNSNYDFTVYTYNTITNKIVDNINNKHLSYLLNTWYRPPRVELNLRSNF